MAALVREPTEKDVEREAQRGETLAKREPALTALTDFTQARDVYENTPPDQRNVPVLPVTAPVPAVTPAIGGAPTVPFTAPGSTSAGPGVEPPPDQPPESAPTGPAAPASPFGAVADQLVGLQQRSLERADQLRREKAEAVAPRLEAAETAQQRFVEALGQQTKMRPRPATTPPPSRGLRDFLEPIQGEPPERSLGRLIQTIGLFAMGIGGLSRGYVGASLSGLIGAMQGWQEGDVIRADRAIADWKENTDYAVKEWEREKTAIQEAMTNANMELQQRFKLVEITSLMHDNKIAAELARAKDLEGLAKYFAERSDKANQLTIETAKVYQAFLDRAMKDQHHYDTQDLARQRLALDRQKAQNEAAYRTEQTAQGRERLDNERTRIALEQRDLDLKEEELRRGKPTPDGSRTLISNLTYGKTQLNEIQRLMAKTDTVNLSKVMGGMTPYLNEKLQQGALNKFIPIPDTVIAWGKGLTSDENKLVYLVNDYVDSVIRARTGAAVTAAEYETMAGFLPMLTFRPEVFRDRIAAAQMGIDARVNIENQTLRTSGFRVPTIIPPALNTEGWEVQR